MRIFIEISHGGPYELAEEFNSEDIPGFVLPCVGENSSIVHNDKCYAVTYVDIDYSKKEVYIKAKHPYLT